MFNPSTVKKDFPILARTINGKPLVYLDSGATSQKPRQVLHALHTYYEEHNANIHRGAHRLSDEATIAYEQARKIVAQFIHATLTEEVIFVRNTTEAINLVAYSWGLDNLIVGDVILSTEMEHHSNLVPWQEVARRTGARVELVRVTPTGDLDLADYKAKLRLKPKIVALVHVSNTLGTLNPISEMTKAAHKVGAVVLVDGAQAVAHLPVDVTALGCDFYAFSGHKILGPMGIGVLYGKKKLLNNMSPFLSGGGMISEVYTDHTTWNIIPEKFEAGTPNVAGAVGLAAAVTYLDNLGMEAVYTHDRDLVEYALTQLSRVDGVEILGTINIVKRVGSVNFNYTGVHAHDVATILDSEGVAVRSGHHCTMVLHNTLGVGASVRASFAVYTTRADIDALVAALTKVKTVFRK
jgi:cysteine desulfurase / selenocysteine lyase